MPDLIIFTMKNILDFLVKLLYKSDGICIILDQGKQARQYALKASKTTKPMLWLGISLTFQFDLW